MEQIAEYAMGESPLLPRVSAVWSSSWYVIQRVLAILAVLGITWGLVAAEVELATLEQVTEPVPR